MGARTHVHAHRARDSRGGLRTVRRSPQRIESSRRSVRETTPRAPRSAPDDLRRTLATAASAVLPGLGQLVNGRFRLARWFAIPVLILLLVGGLLFATNSPARLFASLISPTAMSVLLALNVGVLAWRLAAVGHAFFDGRYPGRPGRMGAAGLVMLLVFVAAPHVVANAWGSAARSAFASVFSGPNAGGGGGLAAALGPDRNKRLNILIVGIDKLPWRTEDLTDSIMVVSIDPVGETVSMASIPRDLVRVPLGDGNVFGPKINSLMSYADTHKAQFPQGGIRSLENAIGALLGIQIHYYAKVDFYGFVKVVDSVGGVDINVQRAFYDPKYDGLGVNPPNTYGWGVTLGPHHFNGWEALAYARSRYAPGESDFTRAARQQEILMAIKSKIMSAGSLLEHLPTLLGTLGDVVTTDLPTDRLPDLAAIADQMKPGAIYRAVLNRPIVKTGGIDPVYGSVQIPDLPAILAVAHALFPPEGQTPVSWPAATPAASAAAAPSSQAP